MRISDSAFVDSFSASRHDGEDENDDHFNAANDDFDVAQFLDPSLDRSHVKARNRLPSYE